MSKHYITATEISAFARHLRDEEREEGTIEKYLRSLRAFAAWLGDRPVTKETAAAWGRRVASQGQSTPCCPR